jgi:hypothetical protein
MGPWALGLGPWALGFGHDLHVAVSLKSCLKKPILRKYAPRDSSLRKTTVASNLLAVSANAFFSLCIAGISQVYSPASIFWRSTVAPSEEIHG